MPDLFQTGPFYECLLCHKPIKSLHTHMRAIHNIFDKEKFLDNAEVITFAEFEELNIQFMEQFRCKLCDAPFPTRQRGNFFQIAFYFF